MNAEPPIPKHAIEWTSSRYPFIIDPFTLARGEPAMLELFCSHCHHHLITYQKDGPGPLLRCYWDRIHAPQELQNLHLSPDPHEALSCPSCQKIVGHKSVYEKEDRLAFTLVEGSVQIREQ